MTKLGSTYLQSWHLGGGGMRICSLRSFLVMYQAQDKLVTHETLYQKKRRRKTKLGRGGWRGEERKRREEAEVQERKKKTEKKENGEEETPWEDTFKCSVNCERIRTNWTYHPVLAHWHCMFKVSTPLPWKFSTSLLTGSCKLKIKCIAYACLSDWQKNRKKYWQDHEEPKPPEPLSINCREQINSEYSLTRIPTNY